MKIHAFSRSLAASTVLLAAPAIALQYGPLEIVGFAKDEYSLCDNCSLGLVNKSSYDPRGVLTPPDPMVNQGGLSGDRGKNLGLAQLTLGLSHEFDNAVKVEGKVSGRVRNSGPDIYDNYMVDLYAGISYPKFGSLQVGCVFASVSSVLLPHHPARPGRRRPAAASRRAPTRLLPGPESRAGAPVHRRI